MITLLTIIHVLVCLFLVAIVLLQHGKGADVGATFGGSSQSLFGSEGPVPLLNKITTFSAIVFMGTSVALAYFSAHKSTGSVMSKLPAKEAAAPVKKEAPVTIPMPQEKPAAAVKPEEKSVQQTAPSVEKVVEPVVPVPAVQQKTEAKVPAEQTQTAPATPAEKKAE
ncbi:preprotein translocase subunit SecG [Desulfobulbus sp. F5]|nr:preprotein translocase subunit SecG [Desulfobulbus sp. F5]